MLPVIFSVLNFNKMKFLEYLLVRMLHAFFRIVPLQFNHKLAQFLAVVIRRIIRYRTGIVRDNLTSSFPNYSEAQINQVIKEVYFNFSCLWTELIQNERFTTRYIDKYIRVHNYEVVEEAQKEGKGLIFLSGHIGNFEWLGYYITVRLNNLNAVMKPVRNKRINDFIIKRRLNQGVQLIFIKGALKRCLVVLFEGQNVALAADQDAGHKGVFVQFFNRPASTAMGAAQLHIKTGAPLIFSVGIRRKWGEFDLYFERIPDFMDSRDHVQNIFNITQEHTRRLENWVNRYPGQYFWTHKRWKTVPNTMEMNDYISKLKTFKKLSTKVQ